MKDIKITKENYKQLFECAGFEKTEFNGWSRESNTEVFCETGLIKLAPLVNGEGVLGVIATFCHHEYTIHLNEAASSTKDLDDAFRIFLDKPLVWQKKWDFESVFERQHGVLEERTQLESLHGLYTHENPRVQAFSRLLFVMEELNEEYKESKHYYFEVVAISKDKITKIAVFEEEYRNEDPTAVFVFGNTEAAELFARDNKEDLETFFNI